MQVLDWDKHKPSKSYEYRESQKNKAKFCRLDDRGSKMLLRQKHMETKVDPRVKRTRQLLQQALMDLMREKSFQAIIGRTSPSGRRSIA
jgi:hypothetical protein